MYSLQQFDYWNYATSAVKTKWENCTFVYFPSFKAPEPKEILHGDGLWFLWHLPALACRHSYCFIWAFLKPLPYLESRLLCRAYQQRHDAHLRNPSGVQPRGARVTRPRLAPGSHRAVGNEAWGTARKQRRQETRSPPPRAPRQGARPALARSRPRSPRPNPARLLRPRPPQRREPPGRAGPGPVQLTCPGAAGRRSAAAEPRPVPRAPPFQNRRSRSARPEPDACQRRSCHARHGGPQAHPVAAGHRDFARGRRQSQPQSPALRDGRARAQLRFWAGWRWRCRAWAGAGVQLVPQRGERWGAGRRRAPALAALGGGRAAGAVRGGGHREPGTAGTAPRVALLSRTGPYCRARERNSFKLLQVIMEHLPGTFVLLIAFFLLSYFQRKPWI